MSGLFATALSTDWVPAERLQEALSMFEQHLVRLTEATSPVDVNISAGILLQDFRAYEAKLEGATDLRLIQ